VRLDYNQARWDEIHRQPAILKAENFDCLKCHAEIMNEKVLPESKAGLKASESLAWYQTLATYQGDQKSFHWRHLESPYAKEVMNLKCNVCHQGNDLREEAPAADNPGFDLRKTVPVKETCLKCHGTMNWQVMNLPTPMPGPWPTCRDQYQNDCLSCHAIYRNVRHQVSYLNAAKIEELAKPTNMGGDVCYGCHGGRAWYRESYAYPRHHYPAMDTIPNPHPEWAKDRPTQSDPRYALPIPSSPGASPGSAGSSIPAVAPTTSAK
jgi:nitrate/TMAO reductase-like tetraheme cytochrome c subunit